MERWLRFTLDISNSFCRFEMLTFILNKHKEYNQHETRLILLGESFVEGSSQFSAFNEA